MFVFQIQRPQVVGSKGFWRSQEGFELSLSTCLLAHGSKHARADPPSGQGCHFVGGDRSAEADQILGKGRRHCISKDAWDHWAHVLHWDGGDAQFLPHGDLQACSETSYQEQIWSQWSFLAVYLTVNFRCVWLNHIFSCFNQSWMFWEFWVRCQSPSSKWAEANTTTAWASLPSSAAPTASNLISSWWSRRSGLRSACATRLAKILWSYSSF